MKIHFLKISLAIAICIFAAVYASCAVDNAGKSEEDLYNEIELFANAVSIIQSDYVEETEPKKIVYGALEGMLASLDDYSQFMDPESFKDMEVETSGEFGGLGIEIGLRDGILTVIAPLDGTPADKAGLKAGDRIVKIDGDVTRDIKLVDAVKKLRGKPGTRVGLSVLREGDDKILDFTITRSVIKLKSIKTAEMLDKNIGYVKLVEFQKKTPRELEAALAGLKKEGMKALVLDVRNNPGGLLDVATDVSEMFLPEHAIVVTLKSRIAKQNRVYKTEKEGRFAGFPIAVVVNKGSASASEIVAGAIQDNGLGIVVGEKTFGKGSVQTVIPLKDGSAVRITTAAYYTPSGKSINEKGIMPDVQVALTEREEPEKGQKDVFRKVEKQKKDEKKDLTTGDNQLKTAVGLLKGVLIYKEKEASGGTL